ncbi:MAG TPA: TadE/TadG family type IV pilus assembly protein [Acidimicrobiales bacterium]|nr:TadE/TadG family type IV pilus assembly protein [Acidimicrobiales bacterium]
MTRRHDSPPASPPRRRHFRRDQSGAAAVEFALVVGLFVFILYGLISFGMILATKQRITNAAAEGARAAVGQTSAAAAVTAATNRVLAAGLPAGAYTPTYATAACGSNQCITVTITYNLAGNPVVPPAPGLGLVTPSTISSSAVVQYS